jgi:predicted acyltransferase
MIIATQSSPIAHAPHPNTERLVSIDIFRGLTMTVMIFVNELAAVRGLPWWTYHMKADVDAMTYVDMVFPFFLFIVGLSFPLAIRQRLKMNPSVPGLWMHILIRTASLMVLGLILANADFGDSARMGVNANAWALIALAGAALFLNSYPRHERNAGLYRWLRGAGLVAVVVMFAIFRRSGPHGEILWIDPSYPEILGLIGYTYFAVAILYIPTRRWLWAPFAWFIALIAFNALTAAGWLKFAGTLPYYFWPFSNGAMAAIVMAGIATSVIFLDTHRWHALRDKILFGLGAGGLSLAAGWLLVPLGISKIRATPSWSLFSIGAAILAFTGLYWVCDVRKLTVWALFARPAGSNTLTTYLIPDLWAYALGAAGIGYFETHLSVGWPGVVRAAVFTALVLAVAAGFTRLKIRLRL